MRKQVLLFLLPFLLFSLFACGKETESKTKEPISPDNALTSTSETTEEPFTEEIPQDPSHIHTFSEATCSEAAKCNNCGVIKGKPLPHDFTEADCNNPKICKVCGYHSGEPKHEGGTASCSALAVCELCGQSYGDYAEHKYKKDSDIVCTKCEKVTKLSYEILEDGVSITKCLYQEIPAIEIPEFIEGKPVISIDAGAFQNCKKLKSAAMPNTILHIGESAFQGCSVLKKITLSENLTTIGKSAFSHCIALKGIEIPEGVSMIEAETFWSCSKLKSLSLPIGLESIGDSAFRHCSKLQKVELPKGFVSIGDKAFANCTDLNVIKVPKSLKEVGNWAFSGCLYLRDVFYEGSVKDRKKIDVLLLNDFFSNAIWHYSTDLD